VNGKARSRMPREGRDTSGACVGLMLVVHCQSLLNLHWIIFSRETVAAAGGYNKQAKRSPSPTSIPILSLQSVPDNTSRIQRYFSVATITIRAAENPVVLSAEREKMPAAVLLTSSPPLACSSSSFSMSSSLGAVVGAAKLPPSLPLLGHLHLIGCLPHRSLHALHLRGGSDGGLLPLQLGRRRDLVASTAAARPVQEPRPRLPPGRATWRGTSSCMAATTCPSRCTACSGPSTDLSRKLQPAREIIRPGLARQQICHLG
jgi:hypothetical protein